MIICFSGNNHQVRGESRIDLKPYEEQESRKMVKFPELLKQFSAEVLGTFLLVFFGDGAIAQKVIGKDGTFLNIALGYGFALMIGIFVSGGISGGHLNPAVTLTMAIFKKCSWIQVPVYMLGQYLGAFIAAAMLYGVYSDGIALIDPDKSVAGSAGIFASYPQSFAGTATLAFDQILGTAMLLIIILAVTDDRNMKIASGLVPLCIGLGLAAIHISFGLNAGCAINPARDFSP